MTYDYASHKTIVLLASNIDPPTALNVMGHLMLAIGSHSSPDILGRTSLLDGSQIAHTGISRFPVIALKGKSGKVRAALEQIRKVDGVLVVDYPREMLNTAHDDELAEALAAKTETDLEYLGVAAYGPSAAIDEIFGRFMLWRID